MFIYQFVSLITLNHYINLSILMIRRLGSLFNANLYSKYTILYDFVFFNIDLQIEINYPKKEVIIL